MAYGTNGQLLRIVENSKFTTSLVYDENGNFIHYIDHLGLISDSHVKDESSNIDFEFQIKELPRRYGEDDLRILLPYSSTTNVTSLHWNYFVRQKSRTFEGFSGLAKQFFVNKTNLVFTSEMHPFSGLQALYDHLGKLLLKVEEYYVPPR